LVRVRPEQFEVAPLSQTEKSIGCSATFVTAAVDRFHCGDGVDVLDQLGKVGSGINAVVALDRHGFEATSPEPRVTGTCSRPASAEAHAGAGRPWARGASAEAPTGAGTLTPRR